MTALPFASLADMYQAGEMLARTNMVGAKTPYEGLVIVSHCHQAQITWLQFAETYNVVFGRVAMRADAMLANYQRLGGTYTVDSRTADLAALTMTFNGASTPFSCAWAEIADEDFAKKNPKYGTPRGRMQMMWARVVSDAVRTICPQANAGCYTPEEVEDFGDTVTVDASPAPAPIQMPTAAPAAPTIDYSVCPIDHGDVLGRAWSEFETSDLQTAIVCDAAVMTDGHRAHIRVILEQREVTA